MTKWKYSQTLWLQLNYLSFNIADARSFIKKSDKSIYNMKAKLRLITEPNWTDEEIKILMDEGPEQASFKTNRTLNSCRIKKSRLCKLIRSK